LIWDGDVSTQVERNVLACGWVTGVGTTPRGSMGYG
jgi:hypothetical protein